MRLGGGRLWSLLGGLCLLCLHMRLMMADGAAGRGTQHGVMAGHMASHAADGRARHATGRVSR